MGREISSTLWRTADILAAEEAWLADLAVEAPLPKKLPIRLMLTEPIAKQRRVIRAWLAVQEVAGIGYREVELVRTLLDASDGPAKINLPRGLHVRRRAGVLFLE